MQWKCLKKIVIAKKCLLYFKPTILNFCAKICCIKYFLKSIYELCFFSNNSIFLLTLLRKFWILFCSKYDGTLILIFPTCWRFKFGWAPTARFWKIYFAISYVFNRDSMKFKLKSCFSLNLIIAKAWLVLAGKTSSFIIVVLPNEPAIEKSKSSFFSIDLLRSLLWVSSSIKASILVILLFSMLSTLIKFIPVSAYFLGVVPFVIDWEISFIITFFHSSSNPLNRSWQPLLF